MKLTILYFDDEPTILENFWEMFDGQHEVLTTTSLAEARRIVRERAPDIIISDQRMPEIEGTEFLREVALLQPNCLRILVTGHAQMSDVLIEISTGIINFFIPKPWTEEYMSMVLERAGMLLMSPARMNRPESERRIAPRHKARLESSVLMIAAKETAAGHKEQMLTLTGYTHDISESGVGLIVAAEDMEALDSLGATYTLRLVLTLPKGPVELLITPVRYQQLEEGREYLIGAQITDMSGRDRVRYMEYISEQSSDNILPSSLCAKPLPHAYAFLD
ncbi:MAG TPA: response regulator [Pyrinomonadaceae bacterium]|nr:response regulator [Pyrinomonadaceae bacterium]